MPASPSTLAMLNESEQELLRECEPASLSTMDEDQLSELHDRIRRTRRKYTKLYRRRAGEQVGADASRGRASAAHARTRHKAEVFEDALARVSRELSKAAAASAKALKAERLAAARGESRGGTTADAPRSTGGARSAKVQRRTPATKKASATARSRTKRAQARSDAR
ncbi:MAG: hypothetical protein ACOYOP_00090 [Microthrixaceae bacterium]